MNGSNFSRLVFAAICAACCLTGTAASAPAAARPAAMLPLGDPITDNGEFLEVSRANTLLCRYESHDFQTNLEFYLARARQTSQGQTPGKIRIREVFIRHFNIIARNPGNPDGKIEAVCDLNPKFIEEAPEYEKLFSDTLYAASNGAVQIEFAKPLVIDEPLLYDTPQDLPNGWWFRPKKIEAELLPYMKDIKPGDLDFMMFFLGPAKRNDNGKLIWPLYGGMAWGKEEINGARLLTLNDHELARGLHEFKHHIFDTTIQETEAMTVTRFHGMTDAGYFGSEIWTQQKIGNLSLGPIVCYYWDCYRYYYPRDMWERWQLHSQHNIPHEPYSGKPYQWADVKNDYWFKLPQLKNDSLRQLTGLSSLSIAAGVAYITLDVDPSEKILSPRLDGPVAKDTTLNNSVNFFEEDSAVLKTDTGTWIFVKPQVADFYIDMLRLRGDGDQPLPVYGYILDDEKALLVLKYPSNLPLPMDEAGFFRPPRATVQADGLDHFSATTFRESLTLSIKPDDSTATVRYTLDDTDPTSTSPLYSKPIKVAESTVLRAAFFGKDGKHLGPDFRGAYDYRPLDVQTDGVVAQGTPSLFQDSVTLTMKCFRPNAQVRYTTDGFLPTAASPVYTAPITITQDTIINAQIFDLDGKPHGNLWTGMYVNHGREKNLTTGKPVTASISEKKHTPEIVVSGRVLLKNWWGGPAPQWLQVDLQKIHKLDRAVIYTPWDGHAYDQYTIDVSTDGKTWKRVADMSKNTNPATPNGAYSDFPPTEARYVKITLLKNSESPRRPPAPGRVFEAK